MVDTLTPVSRVGETQSQRSEFFTSIFVGDEVITIFLIFSIINILGIF